MQTENQIPSNVQAKMDGIVNNVKRGRPSKSVPTAKDTLIIDKLNELGSGVFTAREVGYMVGFDFIAAKNFAQQVGGDTFIAKCITQMGWNIVVQDRILMVWKE